jgi:replication factor A1
MKTESYINKIIEETGLTRKEIQDKVEEKKKELKGLISEEGALFIIAKELGVDVKEENRELLKEIDINISDLTSNMKNITLTGRIKQINTVFNFTKKDGTPGRVGSFVLNDNTGEIRIVLWDEDTKILENSDFEENAIVKIINGYMRKGKSEELEIHIGKMGKIILSPEDVDHKKYPKIKSELTAIGTINLSLLTVSVEGKIIQKYPIKDFIKKDGENGKVGSITLMDSSGSVRITFWNENTKKLDGFEVDDTVDITNLNPKLSSLDGKTLELFATNRSVISKKDIDLEIRESIVEKIKDLQGKQNLVSFQGIISSIDNLKYITSKSGEELALLNFIVSDDSDGIRVTIWREKAEEFSKILKLGSGVLLNNVLIKFNNFSGRNEGSFIKDSRLELIDLKIDNLKTTEISNVIANKKENFTGNYTKISEINSPNTYEVKGFIAKEINNITIYEACSKCFKKIENCKCEDKNAETSLRMIINLIIDDESGTIRATFMGEKAEKLLGEQTDIISKIKETPDFERFLEKISVDLLGKDIIVRGKAKFSNFSNTYELVAYDFKDIDINEELEKNMREIEI